MVFWIEYGTIFHNFMSTVETFVSDVNDLVTFQPIYRVIMVGSNMPK